MGALSPSTSPPLSRHTGANRYPERQGGAGPFPLSPVEGGSRRIDGSPASPFPRSRGKVRMGVLATNHPNTPTVIPAKAPLPMQRTVSRNPAPNGLPQPSAPS